MPRTTLTAQTVSAATPRVPLTFGPVDAVNGVQWPYTGRRRLIVNNASASPVTVTVRTRTPFAVAGLTVPNRIVTVAAGALAFIIESAEARNATDGMVYVDFSAATSVTAALIDEQ
jgi:hypothetical protein